METIQEDYAEWSTYRANYEASLMNMSDAAFERERQWFKEVYWRGWLSLWERFLKMSLLNEVAQKRAARKQADAYALSHHVRNKTSGIIMQH